MKGIKCCGECTYYSLKTHKCTAGAIDEGKAQDPFYKDCQLPDVVPTDQLIQLRDDLYDADAITMKGIKLLDELIFKNIGRVAMPKVITDGTTKIGAFMLPDRKMPCLCVEKGNTCYVFGHFIDKERANEFMDELAKLAGAIEEGAD